MLFYIFRKSDYTCMFKYNMSVFLCI